ncbi:MAG: hypothetical protein AABN95_10330 [Acidobacteriota bacterium]
MKRLVCATLIVLGMVAFAFAPTPTTAATEGGTITGTAQGVFPAGTALGPVALDGLQLGTGVITDTDGSSVGSFHVVLIGRSLVGQRQEITVDGKVSQGTVDENGSASFSGIASLDFGDGAPLRPGVPFSVTTSAGSLVLAIESTTLPAASLTGGSVTIE